MAGLRHNPWLTPKVDIFLNLFTDFVDTRLAGAVL
jgi:hypothetical protein